MEKGEPHIVIQVLEGGYQSMEPGKNPSEHTVSNAYGRNVDVRVIAFNGGNIAPFWVESWQLVPYREGEAQ